MKQTLALCFLICLSYTVEVSASYNSVMLVSVTLLNMNVEVFGFFGFFRRRRTPPSAMLPPRLEETSVFPNGPVFPFSQGSNSFNSFTPSGQFGGNTNQGFGNSFPGNGQQQFRQQMIEQMTRQQIPANIQEQVFQQMQNEPGQMEDFERFAREEHGSPGMNVEEAESFFTLLAETDESQCISRLICEMGADPTRAGQFGQTIAEIINGLQNFPPGTKSANYNRIMQTGRQQGVSACASSFSVCDNESLEVVKNAQMSDG